MNHFVLFTVGCNLPVKVVRGSNPGPTKAYPLQMKLQISKILMEKIYNNNIYLANA